MGAGGQGCCPQNPALGEFKPPRPVLVAQTWPWPRCPCPSDIGGFLSGVLGSQRGGDLGDLGVIVVVRERI